MQGISNWFYRRTGTYVQKVAKFIMDMTTLDTQTPERIHLAIEKRLAIGASYIDALVEYAEEHNLEIEAVADIIKKSPTIKEKIRVEAKNRRLLKNNDTTSTHFFE